MTELDVHQYVSFAPHNRTRHNKVNRKQKIVIHFKIRIWRRTPKNFLMLCKSYCKCSYTLTRTEIDFTTFPGGEQDRKLPANVLVNLLNQICNGDISAVKNDTNLQYLAFVAF